MLNEKDILFRILYTETHTLVQDIQKIHANFYGYAPQENDMCVLKETQQESGNYILQKYVQGSWKHFGILSRASITEALRKYRKVVPFGHFDEGYYRG